MHTFHKSMVTIYVLISLVFGSALSVASDHNATQAAPSKYVGTYFGQNGSIVTFHADGTYSAASADMFTEDPSTLTGGAKSTPDNGVWKVIGDNKVRVTSLRFLTEAFGHNYRPNGLIAKISYTAVFQKPVQGKSPGYTTDFIEIDIFLPEQNPTTDTPIDEIGLPFDGRGFRLETN